LNPIFKEYVEFLNNNNVDLKLDEGYYWLDKQIIKAYDKQGNIHKIARLYVDENLSLSYKEYKKETFEIESWNETIIRNKEKLNKLEYDSLYLIRSMSQKYKIHKIICPVSGGKDSSIVEHLLKMSGLRYILIFNNTSNETHITYKYIKQNYKNIKILSPKEGFYSLIERTGTVPSRFNRYCCTVLKEGVTINQLNNKENILFFMGMRKEESKTRSEYEYEWKNTNWKSDLWQGILPILDWTEEDVWLYILDKNIQINSLYKYGFSRVGCTYCPYRSNHELLLTKHFLPKYHNRWQNVLQKDFIDNGKATVLNCTLTQYLNGAWRGGKIADVPTNEVINEFAQYKNIENLDVAKKYFNKTCSCGKNLKKDEIALSMKYFGRWTNNFMCFKCLGEKLELKRNELKTKIKEFKNEGCNLF
jgi:3'-phosphoadenosine 5'-phosphosulfate sulfotransferase (PAPS reductase)/FAD synthetase